MPGPDRAGGGGPTGSERDGVSEQTWVAEGRTVAELQQRAASGGLQTASLDEVLCITALSLNQAG
jgi:hypothetical protein